MSEALSVVGEGFCEMNCLHFFNESVFENFLNSYFRPKYIGKVMEGGGYYIYSVGVIL